METVSAEYVEESNGTLIDVLSEEHFEEEHIPGAINIPLDRIASEAIEKFDKDEEIVVYCKDEDCGASPKAAEKLEKLGFRNVKDFEGGLKTWKEAGNEIQSSR
jgi:rhodanese-related sulfurtransferase